MEAEARVTITCGACGKVQPPFYLKHYQLLRWRQGQKIQDILPEEPPDRRELLISGTCGPCFDRMFGEED